MTDARRELPDARQLLTDSLDAMNAAGSFILGLQELRYDGEPGLDTLETTGINNSICDFLSYTFEAPDSLIFELFSFQNRSLNWGAVTVIADQTQYFYQGGVDSWGDADASDETFQIIDEALVSQNMLQDSAMTWTVVAIEELDGVDVYHVRGDKVETDNGQSISSFHYWIGVDDHLIRKAYKHINSPDYNDAEKRRQNYTVVEVSNIGEVFNIQLPLEN